MLWHWELSKTIRINLHHRRESHGIDAIVNLREALLAMMIFMRENSRSTLQGNCKAAKPVCDYLSNSCARPQANSVTRVTAIESARASYLNKYLAGTLRLHARYKQKQFRLCTIANLGQQKQICTCFRIAIVAVSATCICTRNMHLMHPAQSKQITTKLKWAIRRSHDWCCRFRCW